MSSALGVNGNVANVLFIFALHFPEILCSQKYSRPRTSICKPFFSFFHFQSGRPGSGRPGSARSRLGSAHGRQGKNDYLYKVTVITGDRKNAGTDSKVSTILIACDVIEIFMDIGHVLAQFCRGCNHSVSFVIRNHLARVICSYGLILFLTSSKGVAISTFQALYTIKRICKKYVYMILR